ncbi:MAG: hypothetical protein AB7T22_11350 [Calditrichaceae bacterium]
MKLDKNTYRLTDSGKFGKYALIAGSLALLITFTGYFIDSGQFFHSYLVAYMFWVTLGLGGLFFTLLNHLVGAQWSIVLRRITETLMMVLPVMAVFFVPLVFGFHDLYHWSHPEAVAQDALLQKKAGYLNIPFFLIRSAVYFSVWYLIARVLYKTSIAQDNAPDEEKIEKMKRISAPAMILFALTSSFAAFDWLMSLDPHWYSTIYGVYFFSGSLLSLLAFTIIIGVTLRNFGILDDVITIEHYHDLAKLLFSFIIFWAYMGFSQYFLIWYANIPEETIWYTVRWEGTWKYMTMTIVLGHFLFPFLGLMTRSSKRNLKWLTFMSVWVLIMHWIDLYWLTFPTHSADGFHFSWMDITGFIGLGGLFSWVFWKKFSSKALVPVEDRRLAYSVRFENN